jgi:hypothetical protein
MDKILGEITDIKSRLKSVLIEVEDLEAKLLSTNSPAGGLKSLWGIFADAPQIPPEYFDQMEDELQHRVDEITEPKD